MKHLYLLLFLVSVFAANGQQINLTFERDTLIVDQTLQANTFGKVTAAAFANLHGTDDRDSIKTRFKFSINIIFKSFNIFLASESKETRFRSSEMIYSNRLTQVVNWTFRSH